MTFVNSLECSSRRFFDSNPKFSRSSLIADILTTVFYSVVVFKKEDYNTIVETSAIKDLLNFELESEELRYDFY